jgi:hypothetical protein
MRNVNSPAMLCIFFYFHRSLCADLSTSRALSASLLLYSQINSHACTVAGRDQYEKCHYSFTRPGTLSLPQYFRRANYTTLSYGKVRSPKKKGFFLRLDGLAGVAFNADS